jgi:putative addiction module component (TIGR02574 family)
LSKKGAQVLEEALSLPDPERAELVDRLLTSLESPDRKNDALWAQEAESRIAAFERGEIQAISAHEALDRAKNPKK